MISEQLRANVRSGQFMIRLIWAGQFFSFVLYYIIARFQILSEQTDVHTEAPLPLPVFAVIACAGLLMGLGLRFYLFSQYRAQAFLSRRMLNTSLSQSTQELSSQEQHLFALVSANFLPLIISLGMVNTCALTGLVCSVLNRDVSVLPPFLIAAALGHLLCFPRPLAFIEETAKNCYIYK